MPTLPTPPFNPAEPSLPDPGLLVCIESFTIQRGQMVRVPNFYYQASGQVVTGGWAVGLGGSCLPDSSPRHVPCPVPAVFAEMLFLCLICGLFVVQKQQGPEYINPRQGSFLPPSLASFSWPTEVWDIVQG